MAVIIHTGRSLELGCEKLHRHQVIWSG